MKTNVLKAYNEYVVLANRYRHEKPLQMERANLVQDEIEAKTYTPELLMQDHFLIRETGMLLQRVKLAHLEFAEALKPEGFTQGDNIISVPKTTQYGELIVAPRYQSILDYAAKNEWDEVDVPYVNTNIHLSGRTGSSLIYGFYGMFGELMPYPIHKPIPKFSS